MTIYSPRPVGISQAQPEPVSARLRWVLMLMLAVLLPILTPPAITDARALTFATTSNAPSDTKREGIGDLKKSEVIQSFPVNITGINIDDLKQLPTEYDFSDVTLLAQATPVDCWFSFGRIQLDNGREQTLAYGSLVVTDGRIAFAKHKWEVRGLATPDYLHNEANLVVNDSGNVVGKTPFFLLFTDPGEVPRPPRYVEIGRKKKDSAAADSPEGAHHFGVDDWASGVLRISSCKALAP